jgi:capsule polysaccharide export protein KpsE/RkpR
MATKEITNRESRYLDPELEHELAIEVERSASRRESRIAKLAMLWRERRFLYRCAAAGVVFSAVVAFLLPVRFTSTARLMPPDQAGAGMASMLSALTKAGGELGSIGSDLLGIRTSSDLFVGILHSRTIQDRLINKFDLRRVYGDRRYEDARKELENRTDITSDRKSGIITLKVSDKDPQRAAGLAREYADGLDQIVLTLNISSAHKERIFLEKRLVQVQQDLEAAEKDFANFASKNTAIDVKEQGKAMLGAAADVEGQLIAAQTELEGLRQIYTSNNVRVRAAQARIDELRRQLQKMGGKAGSTDTAAPPATNDLYPAIRELPILGVTYADLFRRAKVQEAVFETLTKQYELARVEEARETPSVKVLDEGDVPERKSYPPRLVLMVMGTFFAVALGAGWLLAAARWHQVEPGNPGRVLAEDVWQTVRSKLSWNHYNGSRDGSGHNSKDLA